LGLSNSDYSIEYTPTNTIFTYGFSCNNSLRHIAVDMNVAKREKTAINLSLSKAGTPESTLLGNKDTLLLAFKDNFIKALHQSLDTLQEESSSVSISNSNFSSTSSDNLTSNKYGSIVSSNSVFSFALDQNQLANRNVIKS